MANTIIELSIVDEALPTLVRLEAVSGLVAPDAAGYVLTSVDTWTYQATIPEACVGVYPVTAENGDGEAVAKGYVWIETDDTGTYTASADFNAVTLRKEANTKLNTIDTVVDLTKVDTTAILADTNELQVDNANGGRTDLLIDLIKAKTDTIGTGAAFVVSPVTTEGLIQGSIVIGDDYNAANSRAFAWEFDAIPGFVVGSTTCKFGIKEQTNPATYNFLITGTVTDEGSDVWKASFDVDKADTESLIAGFYDWSVEIIYGGEEVTIARNLTTRNRVQLVEKQTL